MKSGRTLVELAQEVQRQAQSKRDALVASNTLTMHTNGRSELQFAGENFGVETLAHRQLAEHLGIPTKFYDQLRAHPTEWLAENGSPLIDTTVNSLLRARPTDERRMVRTLDGNARAVLSDRFRPIDNLPVLVNILPVLQDIPGIDWSVGSMEVTDNRMYLKVVNKDLSAFIKPGVHNYGEIDEVSAGVVITNSEVGLGAFRVTPMLFRLVCSNGAIIQEEGRAKYHIGGVLGDDGSAFNWLSDDTIQARSDATIKEMRDVIRAALNDDIFHRAVDSARQAAGIEIRKDPIKAVEWVTKQYSLTTDEQSDVLTNLIKGHDLTLWGLCNAVTATAQTVESYDRSTELESVGGKLLALPNHDIRTLTQADAN